MLFWAFVLVLLNAFFVASEFAMVRVRSTRIEQLSQDGNRWARIAKTVTTQLDAHLSACQLGITIASLALGWIGEPAFARLIEPLFRGLGDVIPALNSPVMVHSAAIAVAFLVITVLHIVLGELAPKSLAIIKPETMSLVTAAPLHWFYRLFYPLIWVLNGISNLVLRVFGIDPAQASDMAHTDEELRLLVSASAKGGYLDETERTLLDNIFEFSERIAREVMVPRGEMVVLYVEDPLEESLELARREGHTRFPVCIEDKDHIIGFVHIKDIFARLGDIQDLRDIVRPLLMVPETISIAKLLQEFQRQRSQMAILVDEYGGTAGLVTVEDVLEEIVGEITDEFDPVEEPQVEPLGHGAYEVDGGMLLEEAQEQFRFTLDSEPEVDTIGGLVFTMLGRQPEIGDAVVLGDYEVEVRETEGFRIHRLRFSRAASRDDDSPDRDLTTDSALPTSAKEASPRQA